MLAVRPHRATPSSINDVRDLIEGAGIEVVSFKATADFTSADARWEVEVDARLVDETCRTFRVWLEPAPQELSRLLDSDIPWRGVLDEDRESAMAASWTMGTCTAFPERPVADFHAQLKMLQAVAPDAVCVLDTNSGTPRSAQWLHDMAGSIAPPPLESLYAIHWVGDEGYAWLHTHGLERCGSIELDIVDVPADFAGLAAQLINVVSAKFIEDGVPDEDAVFYAGQDIELLWLPWQKGVEVAPRGVPGGRADRDDEAHTGRRGLLFAPGYKSPVVYRTILEDNPLLYLSNMATTRAALLAKERLDRFRALLARYGDDQWLFLIKLGYATDGGADNDREHLWFQVHAMEDTTVDATLLNNPYDIERLQEGQRDVHDLALMSDWSIMCGLGSFTPSTVGELERITDMAPPAADR